MNDDFDKELESFINQKKTELPESLQVSFSEKLALRLDTRPNPSFVWLLPLSVSLFIASVVLFGVMFYLAPVVEEPKMLQPELTLDVLTTPNISASEVDAESLPDIVAQESIKTESPVLVGDIFVKSYLETLVSSMRDEELLVVLSELTSIDLLMEVDPSLVADEIEYLEAVDKGYIRSVQIIPVV